MTNLPEKYLFLDIKDKKPGTFVDSLTKRTGVLKDKLPNIAFKKNMCLCIPFIIMYIYFLS